FDPHSGHLSPPDLGAREQPLRRIGASQALRNFGKMLGRAATREDVEPPFWLVMADANLPPVTVEEEWDALEWVNDWIRRVARWWANGVRLAAYADRVGAASHACLHDASGRQAVEIGSQGGRARALHQAV